MPTVEVSVDGPDGVTTHAIDLDLDSLTMRESVRVEELLGRKLFDRLMTQKATETEMGRPSVIRAIIFAKLKTTVPGLELEGFDLDLSALAEAFAESDADPLANGGPSKP